MTDQHDTTTDPVRPGDDVIDVQPLHLSPAASEDTIEQTERDIPGWVRALNLTPERWGHWCCQAGALADPSPCPWHPTASEDTTTDPVRPGDDVIERAARTIYEGFFATQPLRYVPWDQAEESIKDNNRVRACALADAGLLEGFAAEREARKDAEIARPSWDAYFLAIARTVATRSDCVRSKVGAVVVADRRIRATGYNGAPSGAPGCESCPRRLSGVDPESSYDVGPGRCVALHAEANALLHCDRADLVGATLYVTRRPCPGCSRLIAGAGVVRVVTPDDVGEGTEGEAPKVRYGRAPSVVTPAGYRYYREIPGKPLEAWSKADGSWNPHPFYATWQDRVESGMSTLLELITADDLPEAAR